MALTAGGSEDGGRLRGVCARTGPPERGSARIIGVATGLTTSKRALLPKEHGAYGQIAFPLITAFLAAGVSPGGMLLAAAVVAGFLAHEPALVLLGQRGPRAKRELARLAWAWLGSCLAVVAGGGLVAVMTIDPAARWSVAVPAVPAALLSLAAARGAEKSWYGETCAALAFSGAAVPVAMAAGAPAPAAAAVALPFALLFVSATLAVRGVVLRVRGGGDAALAAASRRAALVLAAAGCVVLGLMAAVGLLPWSVLAAATPGLVTAAVIALRPAAPARLRTLGWTLIAASVVTAAIVVAAA